MIIAFFSGILEKQRINLIYNNIYPYVILGIVKQYSESEVIYMYIIGSLLLLSIGFIMIFFPKNFYSITQSWKNDSACEPSDSYLIHLRIGGGIFVFVGSLTFIILLIS